MALIAMLVGIPLFFAIGVVLLIPVIFTMARRVESETGAAMGGPGATEAKPQRGLGSGASVYLLVGMPALAGLSVLHGPVHPARDRSSPSTP
jgi:gluconate:H+ symporter, GntP family